MGSCSTTTTTTTTTTTHVSFIHEFLVQLNKSAPQLHWGRHIVLRMVHRVSGVLCLLLGSFVSDCHIRSNDRVLGVAKYATET